MRHQRGFTLVELLISLTIFALVSVMTFGGLDSILSARERTEAQAERLITLQKAFSLMRRDFEQILDRPIRDQFGDPQPALQQMDSQIEFTRGGRANPLQLPRSALERVRYELSEDALIRTSWRTLDQPIEPITDSLTLLEGIEDVRLRFLDSDKTWHDVWPPINAAPGSAGLPHAIEVTLELETEGEITQLFLLPF